MEKVYFKGNGITFQDILQMISFRYVDCKRFLEPDEFIEREGNCEIIKYNCKFQFNFNL